LDQAVGWRIPFDERVPDAALGCWHGANYRAVAV
jgi:hypothetical protein